MSPVIVGVWVKVRVSFRVAGNQTIVPEEKCPRLGLGFGLGLVLGLGAIFQGGNFPLYSLSIKLKIHYEQSLFFLSFMNIFSEAAICRCYSK